MKSCVLRTDMRHIIFVSMIWRIWLQPWRDNHIYQYRQQQQNGISYLCDCNKNVTCRFCDIISWLNTIQRFLRYTLNMSLSRHAVFTLYWLGSFGQNLMNINNSQFLSFLDTDIISWGIGLFLPKYSGLSVRNLLCVTHACIYPINPILIIIFHGVVSYLNGLYKQHFTFYPFIDKRTIIFVMNIWLNLILCKTIRLHSNWLHDLQENWNSEISGLPYPYSLNI